MMEDAERIAILEKKVRRLEIVKYVQLGIIVLGFLGLTAVFTNELKKFKLK